MCATRLECRSPAFEARWSQSSGPRHFLAPPIHHPDPPPRSNPPDPLGAAPPARGGVVRLRPGAPRGDVLPLPIPPKLCLQEWRPAHTGSVRPAHRLTKRVSMGVRCAGPTDPRCDGLHSCKQSLEPLQAPAGTFGLRQAPPPCAPPCLQTGSGERLKAQTWSWRVVARQQPRGASQGSRGLRCGRL